METNGNNIDNLFKEVLLEHEVAPPEEVWTNISEQMKKKKSKKLIVLRYRIAAGVTILLASAWFITKNINKEINNTQTLTENNQLINDKKNNQNAPHESIQPLLSSKQNNNNTIEQNGKNTNSFASEGTTLNKDKALLASKENKSSNKRGIFRIKNEKEQFGVVNKEDIQQDINNSIEELAMLAINLKIEKPKEQLIYDWTEIKIIHTKTNKENQWEVGGYYAPLYSYRALEMGSKDFEANTMMSNSEQGQYTYSGGFSVNYKVTRRLSIGTGLSVVNHSYKVSNVVSLASLYNLAYFAESRSSMASNQSYSVNNSIGQITTSGSVKSYSSPNLDNSNWVKDEIQAINNSYASPDNQTINQSFDYMEVPLFLRFKVIDKNFGIHLVSGVSSYFLVNNKVTIKSPNQPDIAGKTLNIKTTNLSGSLGMGLNYRLAQNLKINMEPIFKIFLNSVNTSNSTNVYPYSFGIYSGVSYSF